jgi:hypothetical protein
MGSMVYMASESLAQASARHQATPGSSPTLCGPSLHSQGMNACLSATCAACSTSDVVFSDIVYLKIVKFAVMACSVVLVAGRPLA